MVSIDRQALFTAIEDIVFQIKLNTDSTRLMLKSVERTPEFELLLGLNPRELLVHMEDLAERENNLEYANPYAIPLSVYMHALSFIFRLRVPNALWFLVP